MNKKKKLNTLLTLTYSDECDHDNNIHEGIVNGHFDDDVIYEYILKHGKDSILESLAFLHWQVINTIVDIVDANTTNINREDIISAEDKMFMNMKTAGDA